MEAKHPARVIQTADGEWVRVVWCDDCSEYTLTDKFGRCSGDVCSDMRRPPDVD